MKALLTRFTLWLCRVLDINPIDHARINNGGDSVARGARWEAFYREDGGLADMILAVRRGYFEASAALGVSDTDRLYEYALADRIAREIERHMQVVITQGKIDRDRIAAEARSRVAVIKR